jgi:CheY-like chemotaxis protein
MHRILIVTDHEFLAESLQFVLSTFGHEVEIALDGVSALERATTFRPTAALIDVDLGGGPDGYEVAHRLRSLLGPDVFLIVHTGYCLNDVRTPARAAGFDAYLAKPSHPEEIRELLKASGRTGPLWEDPPAGGP